MGPLGLGLVPLGLAQNGLNPVEALDGMVGQLSPEIADLSDGRLDLREIDGIFADFLAEYLGISLDTTSHLFALSLEIPLDLPKCRHLSRGQLELLRLSWNPRQKEIGRDYAGLKGSQIPGPSGLRKEEQSRQHQNPSEQDPPNSDPTPTEFPRSLFPNYAHRPIPGLNCDFS